MANGWPMTGQCILADFWPILAVWLPISADVGRFLADSWPMFADFGRWLANVWPILADFLENLSCKNGFSKPIFPRSVVA